MFAKIAGFEFRYQLRQPIFWIVALIFFLLTYGSITVDQIRIGSGGNVHKNAPFSIAQIHLIWTLFFMFVTTAFVSNVVVRDDDTGFGPIIRATRVKKFDYLFGRFVGAWSVAALCYLSVPIAIFVGSLMPWIDPETLGPNRLADYAYAYFVLALPGVFLTGAVFFAVATATRSMMWTYVGVVAFFVAWIVLTVLTDRPELEDIAALAEPFGLAAFGLETRYWTAAERNSLMPPLEGLFLYNRLIWIGVGVGFLVLANALYRFADKGSADRKKRSEKARSEAPPVHRAGPLPKPGVGASVARAQLFARTKFEMGQVFKSPAFGVLLALGLFNSFGGLWYADDLFGTEIYPVTRVMIETLAGTFSLIPIIISIYYAGELVWRERERRTHEIIDSTAVPDWAFVLPKTLAITLVLFSTLAVSVLAAILVQALKGYTNFELGKYLAWYIVPLTIDWTLLAVLAVFLQAISPHKFVGWGLMVLYLISTLVVGNLGYDHNLYNYGGSSPVPLSDMNGSGDFMGYAMWFRAYWSAFAVLLLVLAYGLWRRGTETRLWPRLRRLPRRLAGPAGVIALVALVAFGATGTWIYTNTNVWNEYRNRQDGERWQADYEKALLKYETAPRPTVVEVKLHVDVYPHEPRLIAKGAYVLENRTGAPLDEIHLRFDRDTKVHRLSMIGARPGKTYERFNFRILKLDQPLQPGERRTLVWKTEMGQRGFRNAGNITRIVDNGTFVDNSEFAPFIGMTRQGLLQDRATRRKYGLPAELRPPKLEDLSATAFNYTRSDWVNADITVSTVAGQTPIAPGYKVSDTTSGGRRTARFVTEAPILHFFSVQSADYRVKTETHDGVALSVYYDAQHPYNAQRMIDAMKAGLDYFQTNFSPYQFRQARIIEFPAYADFAQAFANTMPYSEGIGFIANFEDPEKIDYVTYVTAHELGHQWWAHQVISSDQQGSTVLTETLAQYSALMVMEELYGADKIRKFLKYELDNYLRNRGADPIGEQPLVRVENQGYIHYRKGSLVMYLLKDTLGEDAVNRALRRVIEAHAFRGPPYPRSTVLVDALRAEAGPEHQQLITDLFERITLYDAKVTRAEKRRRMDGRWDLTFTVEARKLYADSKGAETEARLEELFDIGVFTAEPGKKDFERTDVLLFERRTVRTGVQTFTVIVDKEPRYVGVDPYNKRIDRNSDDNVFKIG